MALVMVTGGVWQPARTHKQKQHDLGQDGASSGSYAMLSMMKEWYDFPQSLCKLCVRGLWQPIPHKHLYHCQITCILHLVLSILSMESENNTDQNKMIFFWVGFVDEYCASFEVWVCWVFLLYENTGPPIVVWQFARASSSPHLCADTPEFSWPATEPVQQQGGRQTMCGHWSIVLRALSMEDHPILT